MNKTQRRRFWLTFFVGMCIYTFLLFIILQSASIKFRVSLIILGIGMYVYGYIHGHNNGEEKIYKVLDYMEPGLRWIVQENQQKMYDEEDRKYVEQESQSKEK